MTRSAHRRSLLVSALLAVAMMAAPLSPTAQGSRAGPTCGGVRATKVGTSGNDVIFGTEGRDVIVGLGGNDRINGRGGRDIMCGGDGHDRIQGGRGHDDILGGVGNDSLMGGRSDFFEVTFEGGSQRVPLPDDVHGGPDDDSITGGRGFDILDGGPGDDSVTGDRGFDILDGGRGDDFVDGGAGAFQLVDGGRGNDSVAGGAGVDGLLGGPGNDSIDGGANFDVLLGGKGEGTFSAPIEVNLQTGVFTGEGTDAIDNVEGAAGSTGDDVFIGNDESNSFVADGGDDRLHGGAGMDLLYYFPAFFSDEGVDVDLGRGTSTGEGTDNFDGFEGIIIEEGLSPDSRFAGTEFADTLTGDASDNLIVGGLGNDTIDGGDGNDWLSGGPGDDAIDGGEGRYDLIDFSYTHFCCALRRVRVDLDAGTALGQGSDSLHSVEAISGTPFRDVLRGDAGVNFIFGQGDDFILGLIFGSDFGDDGADVIAGRGGDDALGGGPGADDIDGGDGDDQCGNDPVDTILACEGIGLPPAHPLRDVAHVAVSFRRNH